MARFFLNEYDRKWVPAFKHIDVSARASTVYAHFKDFQHIRCIISISDPLSLGWSRIDRTHTAAGCGCGTMPTGQRGRSTSMCHGILDASESTVWYVEA